MEFDFDGQKARATSNAPEFTVSELSGKVKNFIESEFSYVRVRGELGRVSTPASGHVYLDLKDDKSVISGVIWRGKAAALAIRPEQGLEVIAVGKLTTFPGQSKYQIVIDSIEPAGQGALMALLEERKKKLAAEGLFDESIKKKLPFMPKTIGIVTSPTGAVIRDMMHGFRERFPVHVIVWPVRVQGESASKEVARAIVGFNKIDGRSGIPRPDVLIVARGGGSLEDLWGFNEEIVARAAASSDIPLISAVGHETDWTLIDYVSDARAPTPTKAAEWAVPKYSELVERLGDLKLRQLKTMSRQLQTKRSDLKSASRGLPRLVDLVGIPRQRLDGAAGRLGQALLGFTRTKRGQFQRFDGRLQPHILMNRIIGGRERIGLFRQALGRTMVQRLKFSRETHNRLRGGLRPQMMMKAISQGGHDLHNLQDRRDRAIRSNLKQKRQRLQTLSQLMNSLGYQNVLARGFALVRDEAGEMVRGVTHLNSGDRINVEFVDGKVLAEIQDADGNDQNKKAIKKSTSVSQKPKKAKKIKKNDDGTDGGAQGSLF
ncbi:MAG: exodeoxyribonuclease 7 large subunit [Methyloligella sp.]|nr:MAG: exodeoxyribonuclease 7 large subunit [Methyloligella sp.]